MPRGAVGADAGAPASTGLALSQPHNRIAQSTAGGYHRFVNVIWRTLLTIWRAKVQLRRKGLLEPTAVGRVRVRTLPTDLDLVGHMNNGRYGSLFDLGRFDLLIRTGIWDVFRERGWYAVVANETITFRKSLELWQPFIVESRLLGHDDKSAYLMHRAVVKGEVYAEMIVRARFLRRSGGIVSHEELFEALHRPDNLPELAPWVLEWAAASALPSTRKPAPSLWR
jgi:acyl-CoA thioesterase FadM